jgi:hypothetical protein
MMFTFSGRSSIGLPTDKPATFDATVAMALKAGVTFAQFVMMTPFPGTVDFGRWEKEQAKCPTLVNDVPITRYWLIPTATRPKMFTPHPSMSSSEISERTQRVWDRFYNLSAIWQRSACVPNPSRTSGLHAALQALPADVCGNGNLNRQRAEKEAKAWARLTARQCRKLFQSAPMPGLKSPDWDFPIKCPQRSHAVLLIEIAQIKPDPFVVLPDS